MATAGTSPSDSANDINPFEIENDVSSQDGEEADAEIRPEPTSANQVTSHTSPDIATAGTQQTDGEVARQLPAFEPPTNASSLSVKDMKRELNTMEMRKRQTERNSVGVAAEAPTILLTAEQAATMGFNPNMDAQQPTNLTPSMDSNGPALIQIDTASQDTNISMQEQSVFPTPCPSPAPPAFVLTPEQHALLNSVGMGFAEQPTLSISTAATIVPVSQQGALIQPPGTTVPSSARREMGPTPPKVRRVVYRPYRPGTVPAGASSNVPAAASSNVPVAGTRTMPAAASSSAVTLGPLIQAPPGVDSVTYTRQLRATWAGISDHYGEYESPRAKAAREKQQMQNRNF